MRYPRIRRILIERGAEGQESIPRILRQLPGVSTEWIDPEEGIQETASPDMDKETLRMISYRGEFLKPCPGTKGYICCGYRILQIGTNCPLDCSYCILQGYFNKPALRVFVNLIGRLIDDHPEGIFRIGTGEFSDSLALDHILGWSDLLLPFFASRKNAVLELKTKTDRIEGLLSSPHRDRIIVSWSLNSHQISAREEKGAPSIRKRIEAAKRCQEEGYVLGFHFDPLILHSEWREGYTKVVDMLDHYIDPDRVIWISLGCLRYMPILKEIARRRHLGSRILHGEFVPGLDQKMRYFKPIRIEMYSYMAEILLKWFKHPGLYLCMESDEVWSRSLGWSPEDSQGLSLYLDARVKEVFG